MTTENDRIEWTEPQDPRKCRLRAENEADRLRHVDAECLERAKQHAHDTTTIADLRTRAAAGGGNTTKESER